MKYEDFKMIYDQMTDVFKRDKDLTHIEVVFHIQKIKTERKTARISVKTFKD
jgi:hypothetical protein